MIQRDIPIIPGETVIREYRFMTLDFRPKLSAMRGGSLGDHEKIKRAHRSTTTLTVTNKRLVFKSEKPRRGGGRDSQVYQMDVRDAGDVTIVNARWRRVLWPIVLMLLGVVLFFITIVLGILAVIGLALLIYNLAYPKNVAYVAIGNRSTHDGFFLGNVSRNDAENIYFSMKPTPEFHAMASELGTLILDLQTNGDECLPRWMRQQTPGADDDRED